MKHYSVLKKELIDGLNINPDCLSSTPYLMELEYM